LKKWQKNEGKTEGKTAKIASKNRENQGKKTGKKGKYWKDQEQENKKNLCHQTSEIREAWSRTLRQ